MLMATALTPLASAAPRHGKARLVELVGFECFQHIVDFAGHEGLHLYPVRFRLLY